MYKALLALILIKLYMYMYNHTMKRGRQQLMQYCLQTLHISNYHHTTRVLVVGPFPGLVTDVHVDIDKSIAQWREGICYTISKYVHSVLLLLPYIIVLILNLLPENLLFFPFLSMPCHYFQQYKLQPSQLHTDCPHWLPWQLDQEQHQYHPQQTVTYEVAKRERKINTNYISQA